MRRSLWGVLAGILCAGILTVSAGPVSGTTPLTINWMDCTSNGHGTWSCFPSVSGGVQPYSATWTVTNGGLSRSSTGSALGTCALHTTVYITYTVYDSSGQSATDTDGVYCDIAQ